MNPIPLERDSHPHWNVNPTPLEHESHTIGKRIPPSLERKGEGGRSVMGEGGGILVPEQ